MKSKREGILDGTIIGTAIGVITGLIVLVMAPGTVGIFFLMLLSWTAAGTAVGAVRFLKFDITVNCADGGGACGAWAGLGAAIISLLVNLFSGNHENIIISFLTQTFVGVVIGAVIGAITGGIIGTVKRRRAGSQQEVHEKND